MKTSMKTIITFLTFIQITFISHGNISTFERSFKQSYQYIATEVASKDIAAAYRMADSLLNATSEDKYKMRVLMLIANLNLKNGNYSNAIFYAIGAQDIAKKLADDLWVVRINGFLSTSYRYVGLKAEGKVHLEKAIEVKGSIKESPLLDMMIDQEVAFYQLEDGLYNSSIKSAKSAQNNNSLLPEEQKDLVFAATNYYLIGAAHYHLKNYDSAYYFFHEGLASLGDVMNEAKGFLLLGLAQNHFQNNSFDSAAFYLNAVEAYTNGSDNFNLKMDLAEAFSEYHKTRGNNVQYQHYSELFNALSVQRSLNTQKIANEIISNLNADLSGSSTDPRSQTKYNYTILLVPMIVVGLALFVLYKQRNKYLKKRSIPSFIPYEPTNNVFKPILLTAAVPEQAVEHDDDTFADQQNSTAQDHQAPPGILSKPKGEEILSEEAANNILKSLTKFEKDNGFLKKDISLTALAAKLKTNTKYLSHVLNNHLKKDFNQYINELRIAFLINTLIHEEVFWGYKIAFWAEHSGFSSHSKFTTAFKRMTLRTPSEFVQMLRSLSASEMEILKSQNSDTTQFIKYRQFMHGHTATA